MTPANAVAAGLRAALPALTVIEDSARIAAMVVDERRQFRGDAAIVVCPRSTGELAAIVGHCHAHRIAMVPQGGNTGYCGGATPDATGTQVLVSLGGMNRIRGIDPIGYTATVDAGVVLADLHAAVAAQGLLYPLSMGSEGSAQMGGVLSTNAGGLAVLRYGTARELTLGIEVVLPDGSVLDQLTPLRKDNTGYDLRDLFIGAEGTLGIVSAACVKLYPAPGARATAFIAAPNLDAACLLLARLRLESADRVTSFEYLSRRSLDLVLRHDSTARDPFPGTDCAYVLAELCTAGDESELTGNLERALGVCAAHEEVTDAVLARSLTERRALWRLREFIPQAEKSEGGSIKHDVAVAISDIPRFCLAAERAVAEITPAARFSVYGHVGDGNVHFNVLAPTDYTGHDFRAEWTERVSTVVHDVAAQMGGSFSAEHGVGQLKRADLARYESPVALNLMRTLKAALDPRGLMNPGKVL